MKFSIAIPTYNSSKYLKKNLIKFKQLNNLKEVVIVDDYSDRYQIKKLLNIISEFDKILNIKLIQNKSNLGGFSNKYKAVSSCSEEIVYQIDSDNLISNETIKLLNSKNFLNEINDKELYLPSKIYIFKRNYENLKFFQNEKVFSRKNVKLNHNQIKIELVNPTSIIENNSLGYLLNLGNPIVKKKSYIEKLEEGLQNKENIGAACSIAMCFYWLKNSGNISLNKNFSHHHRLRRDSYWISNKEFASKNYDIFLNKIKNSNFN